MKEEFGRTLLNGESLGMKGHPDSGGVSSMGERQTVETLVLMPQRIPLGSLQISPFWLPESLPSLICLGFCLFCLVWYSGVNPFLVRLAGSTNRAPSLYATPHQLQLVCSSKAGVIHSPCSWLGSPAIRYRCCAISFGYLSAGVVC